MDPQPPSERNKQILRLWEEGMTMPQLATKFGITRQRVDQILKKHGGLETQEARRIRRNKSERAFDEAVALFARNYGHSVRRLSEDGATRDEVVLRFCALRPEIPVAVVESGVRATGALFEPNRADVNFSDAAVEAAVFYILSRIYGIEGSADSALMELANEEIKELPLLLEAEGLEPESISAVLVRVSAARTRTAIDPTLTLTRKQYDDERSRAVRDLGARSRASVITWPPTAQTVIKRLGGGYWSDALRSIGITPSERGRKRGLVIFEERDYPGAISDFLEHARVTGSPTSPRAFEMWVKGEERAGRRRPSEAAVRNYFGSWTNAKRSALTGQDVPQVRPPTTTRAASVARTALHEARLSRRSAILELQQAPARDTPQILSGFVREYVREFEVRRREWLRFMIALDSEAVSRRLSQGNLPRRQGEALAKDPTNIDAALTDRYIDGMLASTEGVKNFDGWLSEEAQAEINAISVTDQAKFRVLREIRNVFTHDSQEATERLQASLSELATLDAQFAVRTTVTRRVLNSWATASDCARLAAVTEAAVSAWRAMLAAEAAQAG